VVRPRKEVVHAKLARIVRAARADVLADRLERAVAQVILLALPITSER
jgi:hypothetical protein